MGGTLEVLLAIAVMPKFGWRWLLALSSLPLVIFIILSLVSYGPILLSYQVVFIHKQTSEEE